jgi:spore maturation protein CgeB
MQRLMLSAASDWKEARMVVAGAQYPAALSWPPNVQRITHLPPGKHKKFYNSQRFTLNLTRDEMRRVGYSPSVRLFEAAACGTPIISDSWPGLDNFLKPDQEILITESGKKTLEYIRDFPEPQRIALGANARQRILRQHTAVHRAIELESYVAALNGGPRPYADRGSASRASPARAVCPEQHPVAE